MEGLCCVRRVWERDLGKSPGRAGARLCVIPTPPTILLGSLNIMFSHSDTLPPSSKTLPRNAPGRPCATAAHANRIQTNETRILWGSGVRVGMGVSAGEAGKVCFFFFCATRLRRSHEIGRVQMGA